MVTASSLAAEQPRIGGASRKGEAGRLEPAASTAGTRAAERRRSSLGGIPNGSQSGERPADGQPGRGQGMGRGDKGRRGEQSCARAPFVSRLPPGASRMLLAAVPLFGERLAKGAVPRCRDGCRKRPSRLAVWQQGHFVELPRSFSSLRLILTLAPSQRLSLLKIPLLPAYLPFPQKAL